MIGSCFTDNVGERLARRHFDVDVNPFSTLFNPLSIASAINDALDGRRFDESDLTSRDGRYATFDRHSEFSDFDREALVGRLNVSTAAAAESLGRCDVLILTFGSAIAFRHVATGHVVANCHKADASLFDRERVTIEASVEAIGGVISRLKTMRPSMITILTVSPVRHSGYGLVEDRLSKSRLALACDRLTSELADTIYFPAYEIVVDDLRDYRFYADDLTHPSTAAVDYVYEIFSESFMTRETRALGEKWRKLALRAGHRHHPMDPSREQFERETELLAAALAASTKSSKR